MNRTSSAVQYIILLNVVVYLLWMVGAPLGTQFMVQNFLVSWTALSEGRFWTLITSVFSHAAFWHIFINMFVLASFGSFLERTLGTRRFVIFYLIAGAISSFCHAAVSLIFMQAPDLPALGASGAISGLVVLFSLLYPKEKILLFGLIPIPALFGAMAFVAFDVWGLMGQAHGSESNIGHGAHIGGALVGAVYAVYLKRGLR